MSEYIFLIGLWFAFFLITITSSIIFRIIKSQKNISWCCSGCDNCYYNTKELIEREKPYHVRYCGISN